MADPLKQICDGLGVCRQEALFYLEGFQWDLDAAMEACRSKTLPSPENEKAAEEERSRNEKIIEFYEVCGGSTVDDAKNYLNIHNWNINAAVDSFFKINHPTPSERKNRQSNSQMFSNDGRMAIEQSYLQRFSGDQTSKAVASPDFMQDVLSRVPEFPTNSSEEFDPEFVRAMMPSSMSSSQVPNPSQLKEETIKIFCGRTIGASPKAALDCLNYCKWNVEDAISYFFGRYRIASPGMATAQAVKNFTGKAIGEGRSMTESLEHIPVAVPPMASSQVTESGILTQATEANLSPPNSQTQLIGSSQLPNPMEQFHLQKEFCNKAPEASPIAAHACLTYCKWNLQDALAYFLKGNIEASPEMASSQVDNLLVPPFTESAEGPPNSQAQLYNEQFITSFRDVAISLSREEAIDYLKVCDWDVEEAALNFLAGYSKEQLSAAKIKSLTELPSQSQFEASYVSQSQGYLKEGGTGSFSSSITAGPTETQRSLEEAGEGNVTVAIPGMASSQVDGKAVEEGSSTETFPDPFANQDRTTVGTQTAPDTITITLHLADGTSLDLTFRSNQTVKDIRNAIHERAPDNDRDYYLQSVATGDEYRDLNITVHKISTRGSTTLIQVFPDQ